MNNLEIIVLTTILSTLFLVFIIAVYKEVSGIDENSYKHTKEGGPRVALFNLMARLFDDEGISKKEKEKIYKSINRTISDMESDGIYFPEEVKEELKKRKEKMTCEYSGLPSVLSYYKDSEHHQGHS